VWRGNERIVVMQRIWDGVEARGENEGSRDSLRPAHPFPGLWEPQLPPSLAISTPADAPVPWSARHLEKRDDEVRIHSDDQHGEQHREEEVGVRRTKLACGGWGVDGWRGGCGWGHSEGLSCGADTAGWRVG
jgi:hypothetical protein